MPNYREIDRSHKLVEAQLRAYIGRNTILEDNGFYANIYPVDKVILRAIELLDGGADAAGEPSESGTDAQAAGPAVGERADTLTERELQHEERDSTEI